MSIHDFHSKLTSGKEEGILFAALRRLKGSGGPALTEEEAGWTNWTDATGSSTSELGWAVWEEESRQQG